MSIKVLSNGVDVVIVTNAEGLLTMLDGLTHNLCNKKLDNPNEVYALIKCLRNAVKEPEKNSNCYED